MTNDIHFHFQKQKIDSSIFLILIKLRSQSLGKNQFLLNDKKAICLYKQLLNLILVCLHQIYAFLI